MADNLLFSCLSLSDRNILNTPIVMNADAVHITIVNPASMGFQSSINENSMPKMPRANNHPHSLTPNALKSTAKPIAAKERNINIKPT